MQGRIMWNTRGFLDTSQDKSQLVNMAINRVFFHTTLIKDRPADMAVTASHPDHIIDSVLDPDKLHYVQAMFAIKDHPVFLSFTYDYVFDNVVIFASVDQIHRFEMSIKQTSEGLDITANTQDGHDHSRKVFKRVFVHNDSEHGGEDPGGAWVDVPHEGGNLSIDGMITTLLDEFAILKDLGEAEARDWLP